jgi:hypothetical protein
MVRQLIIRPGGCLEKRSTKFNGIILLIIKKCLRKIDILTDRIKIKEIVPTRNADDVNRNFQS